MKVTGIAAIDKKIMQLTKTEVKKIMVKAMREAAKPIAKRAKDLTPEESGTEANSIKVRAITRSRKAFGVKVSMSSENLEKWYFGFSQFGHHTRSGSVVLGNESMRITFEEMKEITKAKVLGQVFKQLKTAIEAK